jgi:hypothetical protein
MLDDTSGMLDMEDADDASAMQTPPTHFEPPQHWVVFVTGPTPTFTVVTVPHILPFSAHAAEEE